MKYLNFPICLMQELNDKRGIFNIIAFAAMNFAEKISFQKNCVANQTIYLFYRRPYFLTNSIKRQIELMIEDGKIDSDEHYAGFGDSSFNPEFESPGMISEFDNDNVFYQNCIEIYRQHQAFSLLNLNPEIIDTCRSLYPQTKEFIKTFETKYGPDAWTSVKTDIIFGAYDNTISLEHFRLIAAVKSVLGKRNFNRTYKSVLLCRMFGFKKSTILNEYFENNPEMRTQFDLLNRRRQWDRLIDTAMTAGYISHYYIPWQFFVSNVLKESELKDKISKIKSDSKIKINV